MARTAILAIKIISDATAAAKGFDQASKKSSSWERGLAKANSAAKVVTAGLIGIGVAAAKQASELQQNAGAVESVFGSSADAVMGLAGAAAQSVGLATSEYAGLAATLGASLKNLGVSQDQLAGTTDSLITTGADLAATFGGTTADAVDALSAAFRGEYDPIEKYGISIKQSTVNAELAAKGQDKLTGSARTQAETQAKLALIMKQSAAAHGQFGREADTAAGQQQRAAAETKNALAALGSVLLPIITQAAAGFATLARFVADNSRTFQVLAAVVGGLAGAIMLANAAMSAYATVTAIVTAVQTAAEKAALGTRIQLMALAVWQKIVAVATRAWAAVQWLLNAALSANPIGIVIIAIAALVAGFILLYKHSEAFRNIVQAVGRACVVAFTAVWNAIKIAADWLGGRLAVAGRTAGAVISAAILGARIMIDALRARVDTVIAAFRNAAAAARAGFAAVIAVIRLVIAANNQLAATLRGAVSSAFRSVANVARAAWNTIAAGIRVISSAAKAVAAAVAAAFRSAFDRVASYARAAANAAMAPFRALQSLIASVLSAISRIHFPSPPSWLNKAIHGPSVSSSSTTPAAGLLAGPASRTATTTTRPTGGITVNVSGALDPEAVARQITTLLGGAGHRRRGVVRPLRTGAA